MIFDRETIITSVHNPAIKRARSLLRRKGRHEERAFLVEGIRAVRDMLGAGVQPSVIYVRDEPADIDALAGLDLACEVRLVTPTVLASMSDVPHPQGVIAVVPMASLHTEPRYDVWSDEFVLVADGVRDPGNLGTLIRTAAGAGVTQVIITPNSVDPFNPKCVRSAMGAQFLVPIAQLAYGDVASRLAGLPLIALTDADADQTYADIDWTRPCAVIVGGEAEGPSPDTARLASAYVRIPLARNLESLNAGVAGSHVILEVSRQRHVALNP